MTSWSLMGSLLLDVRYALRVLRHSPLFTAVALLTLTLGIAANVVVLGVLNAILFQSLEVSDPSSLYQLRHKQWTIGKLLTSSYPAFLDFRARNHSFSQMAAINAYSEAELRWPDGIRNVSGQEVTGNYFDLLGVQPQSGRFFHEAEEHGVNSAPYIVLSDALWQSAFRADPAAVGRTVRLNDHPFTVVGVAPPRFHGTERFAWPDYWIPMTNEQQVHGADYLRTRSKVAVTVIGRLSPRVTPLQATENLNSIAAQLAREYPVTDDGLPLRLIHPGLLGDEGDVIRGFLYGVITLSLLVLVAACANLATLFASRVADRNRELAIRVALGSSRLRLVRQLLIEALLVSLLGGVLGLLISRLLLTLLNRWPPAAEAHLAASVDTSVILEGLVLTLASALLFGLLPALQSWRSSPSHAIKSGTLHLSLLRSLTPRDVVLGVQIAICTLLVSASLVAVRGMGRALQAPLGFQPKGALVAEIDFSHVAIGAPLEQTQAIMDAICALPGVTAVGSINRIFFTGGLHGIPVFQPGTIDFRLDHAVLAPYVFTISPGYLQAAGTRLLAGRDVSWHDRAQSPPVAVVNQTFAQKMWGQTPALGRRFLLSGKSTEVVGIAEDGKYHDLQESSHPALFLPLPQDAESATILILRSQRSPGEMTAALRPVLAAFAPNLPVTVGDWADSLGRELLPARAATAALGVVGAMAAMLALTGIFGMAAYGVSRRLKELAIRMALGAAKAHVMQAALKRPIVLLCLGSAGGLLSALQANRLLRQIVYDANASDPFVLCGTALFMVLIGIAASAIPARKALRADPSKLMRED